MAAKQIIDEIGLLPRQRKAIASLQRKMISDGVDPKRVQRLMQRRRDKALRLRAETIARTELLQAISTGRQKFWEQAVQQGALDPLEVEKQWMTSRDERVDCKICAPMEPNGVGQRQEIGQPFITGIGTAIMNGPAHPNCRCTQSIVPKQGTRLARLAA